METSQAKTLVHYVLSICFDIVSHSGRNGPELYRAETTFTANR